MPSLANKRQEDYAQALAEGLTQASAALKAGFAESTGHHLANKPHIIARVEEIRGVTAGGKAPTWDGDQVTKDLLVEKAFEAFRFAAQAERSSDMLKCLSFVAEMKGYTKILPMPVEPPAPVDKKERAAQTARVDEALRALEPTPKNDDTTDSHNKPKGDLRDHD